MYRFRNLEKRKYLSHKICNDDQNEEVPDPLKSSENKSVIVFLQEVLYIFIEYYLFFHNKIRVSF